MTTYAVIFEQAENNWAAYVPDLPGCISTGKTIDETEHNIREAIEGAKAGEAEKARRIAEADAVRAEGEAAGAAILAKGQAEAKAMELRAESYSHYNQAAVLEMLVSVLPAMAREVAAPMGQIDKLTVISSDGANALPMQVGQNVVQILEMLKNTPGIDLQELARKYTDVDAAPAITEGPSGTPKYGSDQA